MVIAAAMTGASVNLTIPSRQQEHVFIALAGDIIVRESLLHLSQIRRLLSFHWDNIIPSFPPAPGRPAGAARARLRGNRRTVNRNHGTGEARFSERMMLFVIGPSDRLRLGFRQRPKISLLGAAAHPGKYRRLAPPAVARITRSRRRAIRSSSPTWGGRRRVSFWQPASARADLWRWPGSMPAASCCRTASRRSRANFRLMSG